MYFSFRNSMSCELHNRIVPFSYGFFDFVETDLKINYRKAKERFKAKRNMLILKGVLHLHCASRWRWDLFRCFTGTAGGSAWLCHPWGILKTSKWK